MAAFLGWTDSQKWLAVGLGALALIAVGSLFFASGQDMSQEAENFSVSEEWNKRIARLGIQPLYPPQEDFQVGDVYAVLVALDPANRRWNGRVIMLGHADLERELLRHHARRNRLTLPDPEGLPNSWQIVSHNGSTIPLNAIVFPGFDTNLDISGQGTVTIPVASAGSASQSTSADRIRIPNAMTYGVTPAVALGHLRRFCRDSGMCQKSRLRNLFAQRHGSSIFPENQESRVSIDVHIVTRVFLSSELNLAASLGRAISATGSAQLTSQQSELGAVARGSAESLLAIRQEGLMPRPVVFGYHHIGLSPSE